MGSDFVVPEPTVSTSWLAEHLGEPDLVLVDASWDLVTSGQESAAEYQREHLPGAVFWDLEALSAGDTDLPHMMPEPDRLARAVGGLGISKTDRVVVYDRSGQNLSAPRVWWMLRALGHDAVAVLDGGFRKWRGEGRPVEAGAVRRTARRFTAAPRPAAFRTLPEVRQALQTETAQLLDARSPERFEARAPEPRPGVRGGHIPGSRNLHYAELTNPDGTLRDEAELRRIYHDAGVDLARPVITSCGSGVSACALILGLERLGHRDHAVYDGSWAEWGGRQDLPAETGTGRGR